MSLWVADRTAKEDNLNDSRRDLASPPLSSQYTNTRSVDRGPKQREEEDESGVDWTSSDEFAIGSLSVMRMLTMVSVRRQKQSFGR